jgi:hypothetical protein
MAGFVPPLSSPTVVAPLPAVSDVAPSVQPPMLPDAAVTVPVKLPALAYTVPLNIPDVAYMLPLR